MKYLIYHHSDNDGYLAGAIASLFLSQKPFSTIWYKVGNYDTERDEANIKELEEADVIYVLDYSLPVHLMDKFFDKIVWIDHHRTSMDNLASLEKSHNKPFKGVREIGKSGCLLTWNYFMQSEWGSLIESKTHSWRDNQNKIPWVVKVVDDRDIWKWEYGEATAAFHEISRMFMPYYDEWQSLLLDDQKTDERIQSGYSFLNYIRGIVDVYNDSFSWQGYFEGHPVVFLNGSGIISGELHKRLRESNPGMAFAITFMVRDSKVTVGLYRTEGITHVSLGKIAHNYGGGGHDGAAGFHTNHDEWTKIIKESKYEPGYRRKSGPTGKLTNPRSMS